MKKAVSFKVGVVMYLGLMISILAAVLFGFMDGESGLLITFLIGTSLDAKRISAERKLKELDKKESEAGPQ